MDKTYDYEGGESDQLQDLDSNFQFSEQSIRHAFIRKVYAILMAQLSITMIFIVLFLYVEPIRMFAAQNPWVWWVALIATFICIIALACCPDVRRSFPMNFIFLGIFTICEGFLLGCVASVYHADEVLMAVGIVTFVSLGLTLFAFQTKWDFTMCSGGLLVVLLVLIMFGFICAIVQNRYASIAYAAIGALVFALYLVMDTQMMIGGKHKYSLSPEEYIFAALNLYLDIVNMFLFILSLIGLAR